MRDFGGKTCLRRAVGMAPGLNDLIMTALTL